MSRQRLIWPGIWTDDDFMALSVGARLLFIGMFSTADDHGRGMGSPANLKAAIFPADDSVTKADIAKWSAEIRERGMARFYTAGSGSVFYDLPCWAKWQKVRYPSCSKVPVYQDAASLQRSDTPPLQACSEPGPDSRNVAAQSGEERSGEERSDRDKVLDRARHEKNPPPRTAAPSGAAANIHTSDRPQGQGPAPRIADFEAVGTVIGRLTNARRPPARAGPT